LFFFLFAHYEMANRFRLMVDCFGLAIPSLIVTVTLAAWCDTAAKPKCLVSLQYPVTFSASKFIGFIPEGDG